MMCSCSRAAVMAVLVAIAVTVVLAEAEPTYLRRPHPPPCYPKVHYVTKYQTKYREVSDEGGERVGLTQMSNTLDEFRDKEI